MCKHPPAQHLQTCIAPLQWHCTQEIWDSCFWVKRQHFSFEGLRMRLIWKWQWNWYGNGTGNDMETGMGMRLKLTWKLVWEWDWNWHGNDSETGMVMRLKLILKWQWNWYGDVWSTTLPTCGLRGLCSGQDRAQAILHCWLFSPGGSVSLLVNSLPSQHLSNWWRTNGHRQGSYQGICNYHEPQLTDNLTWNLNFL